MMAKLTLNMRIEPNRPPIAPKPSRPTTLAAPTMPIRSPAAPPPMPSLRANGTRKTRTWNSGMPITTMARYMVRNCAVRLLQPERATGRYRVLRRRPRAGQQQDAAGHAEDDVRRPPAVPADHRDGSDHQHPARPHPVHDRSAHHSEGEVDEAGEGEHGDRSGPTTAELAGHRVEEDAEAVGDAEHREHGAERRGYDCPGPGRSVDAGVHGGRQPSRDHQAGRPVCAPAGSVSYTHLRAHETPEHLVCR